MNDAKLAQDGAVILVNVFTPKPGMLDAFVEAQSAEYRRLKGQVEGALGNRLLRAKDGSRAVNIAYFANVEKYDAWRASALFADHIRRIEPLLEHVEPALYEVAFESD